MSPSVQFCLYVLDEEKHLTEYRFMGSVEVGHRVRMDGRDETYVVLRVDAGSGTADLLLMTGVRRIEENVPLTSLRPIPDQDALSDVQTAKL